METLYWVRSEGTSHLVFGVFPLVGVSSGVILVVALVVFASNFCGFPLTANNVT